MKLCVAVLFAVHCAEAEELGPSRDREAGRAEASAPVTGAGGSSVTSASSSSASSTSASSASVGGSPSSSSVGGRGPDDAAVTGGASGKGGAGGLATDGAAGTMKSDGSPTCAVGCSIKVQYQNTATPPEPMTATVRVRLDVLDVGTKTVALSDITLRYWFTDAGGSGDKATCYSAQNGCPSVVTRFVPVAPARPHADRYLEVGFTGPAMLDPSGHTGTISIGVQHAAGGALYDQTDDYSYAPSQPTFVDWPKITAYVGGMLVWGTEP